jgi:Uma2 family endonuclease
MSQSAALARLPFELVYDDGEPMEDNWHVIEMHLLLDLVRQVMAQRGQSDFFASGNIFVYYSFEQAADVVAGRPYFRGPDFLYVGGVDGRRERHAWVSWEEGGRFPDVIVELLSPSTAHVDRTIKKDLYARTFHTSEYYLYDFETAKLEGFLLAGSVYVPMTPNAQGRLWSQQLGLELGLWHGVRDDAETTWLRFYHSDGTLVPTRDEAARQLAQAAATRAEAEHLRAEAEHQRAETEHQRAETERQRAEAALAELERLRSRLGDPSQ